MGGGGGGGHTYEDIDTQVLATQNEEKGYFYKCNMVIKTMEKNFFYKMVNFVVLGPESGISWSRKGLFS